MNEGVNREGPPKGDFGFFLNFPELLPMGGESNRKIRPLQISCNRLVCLKL